ncbi:hypothetical protein MKX03_033639 [Papaver bracteatum]|nr:hypothetical protein MKX03_033639 [Papaver bracteatum]
MKKLSDKFGVYKRFYDITFDIKAAVYDSQSPKEFEQLWDWMLDAYDLGNNKWVTFFVTYNSEDCDIHCSCQMFAFKGIQCSHVLSVLSHKRCKRTPRRKKILRWWRKDVKRCHTKVKVGFSCWKNDDSSKQYYDLCNQFAELADWVAGTSQYPEINDWLSCKKKETCNR